MPAVRRIIHLRTQHLGPDEILVAVKVLFDATLDNAGVAAAIDDIESHEKEVKKLYLDVSTALNVMSKSYIDKRDMAAVRYAERSTGYNFEADAKEFKEAYSGRAGELGIEL